MKRFLSSFIFIAAAAVSFAQSSRVYTKHVQVTEKLQLKTRVITDFTLNFNNSDSLSDAKIPTAKAVADYVRLRSGGSGGSVAADSVFGNDYPKVGNIVNESFPGVSLSGSWTDVTPATTVTVNNKLTLSGGANDFNNYIEHNKFGPYGLVNDTFYIIPKSLTATSGIGIGYQGKNLYTVVNYNLYIKIDLSNAATAGEMSLWSSTTNKFATSAEKLSFALNDTLMFVVNKKYNGYLFELFNLTVDTRVSYDYNYLSQNFGNVIVPPANKTRIYHFGGTQEVLSYQKYSFDRKNGGVIFVGNSITTMYAGSSLNSRFVDRIFNGDYSKFAVSAGPGETAVDGLAKLNEVYDNNYTYAIIEYGVNDANQGVSAAAYQISMDSIRARFARRGTIVIFTNNFPQNAVDVTAHNTALSNLSTTYGNKVVDIFSVLKNSGNTQAQAQYTFDGIHPNDSGMIIISNLIKTKANEITKEMVADTAKIITIFAPSVHRSKVAAFVGTDIKGNGVRVFNNFVTKDEATPLINGNAVSNGLIIGPQSTVQRGLFTIDQGNGSSLYAYNNAGTLAFKTFNNVSFPNNGNGISWSASSHVFKSVGEQTQGFFANDGSGNFGVVVPQGIFWGSAIGSTSRRIVTSGNSLAMFLTSNAGDFIIYNNNGTNQLFRTYFEGAIDLPVAGYLVGGTTGRMNYFNGLRVFESSIWKKAWLNDPGKGHVPDSWTTAGRPASPTNGQFGYNTTDSKMEYWNGAIWVQW